MEWNSLYIQLLCQRKYIDEAELLAFVKSQMLFYSYSYTFFNTRQYFSIRKWLTDLNAER